MGSSGLCSTSQSRQVEVFFADFVRSLVYFAIKLQQMKSTYCRIVDVIRFNVSSVIKSLKLVLEELYLPKTELKIYFQTQERLTSLPFRYATEVKTYKLYLSLQPYNVLNRPNYNNKKLTKQAICILICSPIQFSIHS